MLFVEWAVLVHRRRMFCKQCHEAHFVSSHSELNLSWNICLTLSYFIILELNFSLECLLHHSRDWMISRMSEYDNVVQIYRERFRFKVTAAQEIGFIAQFADHPSMIDQFYSFNLVEQRDIFVQSKKWIIVCDHFLMRQILYLRQKCSASCSRLISLQQYSVVIVITTV